MRATRTRTTALVAAALALTPQSGCAALDRKLLVHLRDNPEEYYVDAHNAEFPAGALRGQIR